MVLPMSKAFLVVTMAAALGEEKIASIHCMEEDSRHSLHLLQSKGRFTLSRDASLEKAKLMKGVSYGPSLHTAASETHHHNYFCDAAEPVWGRGDLKIIQTGANAVRLYGDPMILQSPWAWMSSGWVTPSTAAKTAEPFLAFKELRRPTESSEGLPGWERDEYHPIKYLIVVNEPELKLPGLSEPKKFAKAIVSAIDGVLDAEEEMKVIGPKPNLTVIWKNY